MLAVPLCVRDHAIGVLACYTTEPHVFSEAEITLFSALANQTALAVENVQLVTNAAVVREMHHRIKNNLQTVAMLLRLQSEATESLTAREVLQTSVQRILSIAAVHETLAQEGFRLVNVKDVAERLAHLIGQNLVPPGLQVTIQVTGESVVLPSRAATSLALVINELTLNALEHAFEGRTGGRIFIRLGCSPREYLLEVTDDGAGFPASLPPASLGLEIVETLVRDDLGGRLEFQSGPEGTQAVVRLPRGDGADSDHDQVTGRLYEGA